MGRFNQLFLNWGIINGIYLFMQLEVIVMNQTDCLIAFEQFSLEFVWEMGDICFHGDEWSVIDSWQLL